MLLPKRSQHLSLCLQKLPNQSVMLGFLLQFKNFFSSMGWWFLFSGGMTCLGLSYIKNQFKHNLRKHFLHLNKCLSVYLQYTIVWGCLSLFGVCPPPFSQISIDDADHLAFFFLPEELHQQSELYLCM